jgi:hypothetical protein
MNFDDEFPAVMKRGGFDVIVGNPPYGAEFSKDTLKYIRNIYKTAKGELDSYTLFIERTLKLIKRERVVGLIIPDTWLTLISADVLRRMLLDNYTIKELILLNESVFPQATVDPLVIIIENVKPAIQHSVKVSIAHKKIKITSIGDEFDSSLIQQKLWNQNQNSQIKVYSNDNISAIINKINCSQSKVRDLLEYKAGCKPYEKGKGKPPQTKKTLEEKPYTSEKQEKKDWVKLIRGDDIKRYQIKLKKPEWIKYGEWLAAPRDIRIFTEPRILIQAIRNPSLKIRILATYTEENIISRINVYSLIRKNKQINYYYILAILNSTLMNWYLKKDYGLHTYVITGVLQLPIRTIDFTNGAEKEKHDHVVSLVEETIKTKEELVTARLDLDVQRLEHRCTTLDRKIDEAVYNLYGLTEEEIRIVEGNETKKEQNL